MMKVDLVDVGIPGQGPAWNTWTTGDGRFFSGSYGLSTLKAMTPPDFEVSIWDEKVSGSYVGRDAKIVGLSFKTMHAYRAYQLADELKQKGHVVVFGGSHASLVPEEALQHSDVVVVNEAESIWAEVLNDIERGCAKKLYSQQQRTDLASCPELTPDPTRDQHYVFHTVQTARGCSLDCEFCPTRQAFGAGFRLRKLESVCSEVSLALEASRKPIFFCDDIFGAGQLDFIANLTSEVSRMHAEYMIISDVAFLSDRMIEVLANSGCFGVVLNMPGTCSIEERAVIDRLKRHRISVFGYFMFGFEAHTSDVFLRCRDFVLSTEMDTVFLTVLSPFRGTAMGTRLAETKRILSDDWSQYDQSQVVAQPKGMTVEELRGGFRWISDELRELIGLKSMIAAHPTVFSQVQGRT